MKRVLMLALCGACGGKAVMDGGGGAGGTSAQNTTTVGQSSVTNGSTGSGKSCSDIAAAYRAAVQAALVCNPALNVEQCTVRVDPDLEQCCDDAWVNFLDKKDTQAISDDAKAYKAAGCMDKCAAVDCAPINSVGLCDAASGKCRVVKLQPAGGGG